ncbi:acylpyruvase FAHD1, mitochondrial-like [Zalophus californianus]|uniref:Oxaloacetate tautomerase FAHD1, mitochondrial n=1 Tax=Zalophus californianus TaxID=9704 RepID=A0A6J2C6D3_ZALCA|nr:acylpyruvase FAHD1, mitochondrial-like [Zalophus californianus]
MQSKDKGLRGRRRDAGGPGRSAEAAAAWLPEGRAPRRYSPAKRHVRRPKVVPPLLVAAGALPEAAHHLRPREGLAILQPACSLCMPLELELVWWWASVAASSQRPQPQTIWPALPGCDHQQSAGRVQEGADLALATSFTVFSPISTFVPKEKIPGPHNLKLWPKVNGKLRQEVMKSSMIFPILYIQEGGIIWTRTPKEWDLFKKKKKLKFRPT